jgi:hypothetical protein
VRAGEGDAPDAAGPEAAGAGLLADFFFSPKNATV